MIAELNNLSDLTKAYELATSLRGEALSVLSDVSPDMRRNYKRLIDILWSRFEPRNQSALKSKIKLENTERN
jgi:hypothetical protein